MPCSISPWNAQSKARGASQALLSRLDEGWIADKGRESIRERRMGEDLHDDHENEMVAPRLRRKDTVHNLGGRSKARTRDAARKTGRKRCAKRSSATCGIGRRDETVVVHAKDPTIPLSDTSRRYGTVLGCGRQRK